MEKGQTSSGKTFIEVPVQTLSAYAFGQVVYLHFASISSSVKKKGIITAALLT